MAIQSKTPGRPAKGGRNTPNQEAAAKPAKSRVLRILSVAAEQAEVRIAPVSDVSGNKRFGSRPARRRPISSNGSPLRKQRSTSAARTRPTAHWRRSRRWARCLLSYARKYARSAVGWTKLRPVCRARARLHPRVHSDLPPIWPTMVTGPSVIAIPATLRHRALRSCRLRR